MMTILAAALSERGALESGRLTAMSSSSSLNVVVAMKKMMRMNNTSRSDEMLMIAPLDCSSLGILIEPLPYSSPAKWFLPL